jgi:hypothetical protein
MSGTVSRVSDFGICSPVWLHPAWAALWPDVQCLSPPCAFRVHVLASHITTQQTPEYGPALLLEPS